VRREDNGSAARRKRSYQNGIAEGLAQGRAESQDAAYQKGLADGKETGRAVGHEVAYNTGLAEGRKVQQAIFQGTQEALIKKACDLQAQLAESSKERFTATETATHYIVECKQRDNLIEALERDLVNERQRSAELQRLLDHLHNPPVASTTLESSARPPQLAPPYKHGRSPCLTKPKQP
jgi:flagellar biosynthesis/type III secretory pathway protein FliH